MPLGDYGAARHPDSAGWELTARDQADLAAYVDRAGAEETSFDDLFDGPTYRAAQTTFAAQSHFMMPRGQTHYRSAAPPVAQGIPEPASSAHWDYLPDASAQSHASSRSAMHAGSSLAWAVARDSARPESGGWAPLGAQAPYGQRPVMPARPGNGPSARAYNFAG